MEDGSLCITIDGVLQLNPHIQPRRQLLSRAVDCELLNKLASGTKDGGGEPVEAARHVSKNGNEYTDIDNG